MSKKGVSKISGNPAPKVGEKTTYMVTDWYPATPAGERNPAAVTWELFKKRSNGSFTTTNIKKKGDGSFTFGEVASKIPTASKLICMSRKAAVPPLSILRRSRPEFRRSTGWNSAT
uniref:Uncharacterized protein n=1 Tax=Chryseobacterium endophyticum TaxID=1854762 RepID=A0AAU6WTA6_9FLAO